MASGKVIHNFSAEAANGAALQAQCHLPRPLPRRPLSAAALSVQGEATQEAIDLYAGAHQLPGGCMAGSRGTACRAPTGAHQVPGGCVAGVVGALRQNTRPSSLP